MKTPKFKTPIHIQVRSRYTRRQFLIHHGLQGGWGCPWKCDFSWERCFDFL